MASTDVVDLIRNVALSVFGGKAVYSGACLRDIALFRDQRGRGHGRDFRVIRSVYASMEPRLISGLVYLYVVRIEQIKPELKKLRELKEVVLPELARQFKVSRVSIGSNEVPAIDVLKMSGNKGLIKIANILEKALAGSLSYGDVIEYYSELLSLKDVFMGNDYAESLFWLLYGTGYPVRRADLLAFEVKLKDLYRALYEELGDNFDDVVLTGIDVVLAYNLRRVSVAKCGRVLSKSTYSRARGVGVLLKDAVVDDDRISKFVDALVFALRSVDDIEKFVL